MYIISWAKIVGMQKAPIWCNVAKLPAAFDVLFSWLLELNAVNAGALVVLKSSLDPRFLSFPGSQRSGRNEDPTKTPGHRANLGARSLVLLACCDTTCTRLSRYGGFSWLFQSHGKSHGKSHLYHPIYKRMMSRGTPKHTQKTPPERPVQIADLTAASVKR